MSAGDFSKIGFNPGLHYAAVTLQQGRVQLDADMDEDTEANSEKIKRSAAVAMPAQTTSDAGSALPWPHWIESRRW